MPEKKLDGRFGPPVTKDKNGNWPTAWPHVQRMAVCTTEGCPVEGIGFDIPVGCSVSGELNVVCYHCDGKVTDLRMDFTPVGVEKVAEYRRNPSLFAAKKAEMRKVKAERAELKMAEERLERINAEKQLTESPIVKERQ